MKAKDLPIQFTDVIFVKGRSNSSPTYSKKIALFLKCVASRPVT